MTFGMSIRFTLGPNLRKFADGSVEGYWGERYKYAEFEGGKYLESSYLPFAEIHSVNDLDRSHFPTADWFDYSTIKQQCQEIADQGYAVCFGTAGDMDFINSIARARGTEQVLIDLITMIPFILKLWMPDFDFIMICTNVCCKAAEGMVDFTHMGRILELRLHSNSI